MRLVQEIARNAPVWSTHDLFEDILGNADSVRRLVCEKDERKA
jgi:hypothetical protein